MAIDPSDIPASAFLDSTDMQAHAQQAQSMPLAHFNMARSGYYRDNTFAPYFKRLREEAPVHYCSSSRYGPFWSISRFQDIKYVDSHHELFSSEPSIGIDDQEEDFDLPMFIAMDPPRHDAQRRTVNRTVSPRSLQKMEGLIRGRVQRILDDLPMGEPFDWVQRVSIELTTQMLATLFNFPFEERARLTRWSNVASSGPGGGLVANREERRAELRECLAYFTELWRERAQQPPADDFVSMLAHGSATKNMSPNEYLGNLILLIVGGNDTTRNSISGSVLALHQYPDQWRKLCENPALVPNMVAETIRWQTPLTHMRRIATQDVALQGQTIRQGDKVVMWYLSGNRDESVFPDAENFQIDRPNARQHVAFGYGIHRCMGNRLAEMQLRILWEEILQRFDRIEVAAPPVRIRSNLLRGYASMQTIVHA